LLEPDVIVFGGGVAQLMSEFFPHMQAELPKWCINARCCEIPLRLAKYGSDAGIAGAAALCRR
jgi:predicted NBD/HSP70 family sugar kinase